MCKSIGMCKEILFYLNNKHALFSNKQNNNNKKLFLN